LDTNSGFKTETWAGTGKGYLEPGSDYLPPVVYDDFLRRSQLGTKIWDYNVDGVAHYGMLPDFLRAVRYAPLGDEIVDNNLVYGAEYFAETWKIAEGLRSRVKLNCPTPAAIPRGL
jgi:hypothetical protein